MIVRDSQDGLYRDEFKHKITEIKYSYQAGETEKALNDLKGLIPEEEALPAEEAMKENFIGVIYFARKDFQTAALHFERASRIIHNDRHLKEQIYLNLAGSYYKLGRGEEAHRAVVQVEGLYLKGAEYQKYQRLRYVLSHTSGDQTDAVRSLIKYFKEGDLADLKSDRLFDNLLEDFFKLKDEEKLNLLDEFTDTRPLIIGHLGYLEAERLYYENRKSDATSLARWIRRYYGGHGEIAGPIGDLMSRSENDTRIDPTAVGVILPLTGSRAVFGRRALLGIDSALRAENEGRPADKKLKIIVKDSRASGVVGTHMVKALVENHSVSVIIGGLFPNAATEEYLEARKYGVFYIGLSQVYAPKEQKGHLLLEIPGSVESQINELFSEDTLNSFGRKAAIVYPKGEYGETYLREFWRKAKLEGLEVTGIVSFKERETDYRDTVRKLLGLSFERERKEEYEILSEVHSLERPNAIRRVQTLGPRIDFDWVFIPSLPKEALQIIPAFSYFDAFNLNIIGTPSWRTQTVVRGSRKGGPLYFIGDDVGGQGAAYRKSFMKDYKKRPKVVEFRSYDAIMIAARLIGNKDHDTRDSFDRDIRAEKDFEGLTGRWFFEDGVWMKEMNTLKISRGKIEALF